MPSVKDRPSEPAVGQPVATKAKPILPTLPQSPGLVAWRTTQRRIIAMRVLWAHLAYVASVALLINVISDRWWFSAMLTYVPRYPLVIPSLVACVAIGLMYRRHLGWHVVGCATIVFPVMEFDIPWVSQDDGPVDQELVWVADEEHDRWVLPPEEAAFRAKSRVRVLTCNVHGFQPDFPSLIREISLNNPDVVALQEAYGDPTLLEAFFADWHRIHVGEFWIGSKYPLRQVAVHKPAAYGVNAAVQVEVQLPSEPLVLTNIHQMTPRRAFGGANLRDFLSGDYAEKVTDHLELRDEQAASLRRFVNASLSRPSVILGDFNMPAGSHTFQEHWGDIKNAFDVVGWGFGYTVTCSPMPGWPSGVAWIRVDHVLTSSHWRVVTCRVGKGLGSDHHLVCATLSLDNP